MKDSRWYAPVGSLEYKLAWFKDLMIQKYIESEYKSKEGFQSKSTLVDVKLTRSHVKTEYDVLVNRGLDLERKGINHYKLNPLLENKVEKASVKEYVDKYKVYQFIKRIESKNEYGILSLPRLSKGNLVEKESIYKEVVVDTALDAITTVNSSSCRRYPILAQMVAEYLSDKIEAPKSKQSVIPLTSANKNLESLIERLKKVKEYQEETNEKGYKLMGAKIKIAGRINGVEMARKETASFGCLKSNTIDVIKDKGFQVAKTRYGSIGVTVCLSWMK